MKINLFKATAWVIMIMSVTACTIIRPGQTALKQRFGRLKSNPMLPGMYLVNPFTTKVVKINVRTVEIYETLPLPTKEGLSIQTQITLLYHVRPDAVRDVYTNFGTNYEEVIVKSNFLATAREVSSRYYAKELYAIERKKVEQVIKDELIEHIGASGFEIDAVLLKDIILPESMSTAIQNKVNAEQAVLQMEFTIQKQKKEAERVYIEAEGIRRAQNIIDSSLTDKLLRYNQIQVLKELVKSPNAKVIVTGNGGQMPMIINE